MTKFCYPNPTITMVHAISVDEWLSLRTCPITTANRFFGFRSLSNSHKIWDALRYWSKCFDHMQHDFRDNAKNFRHSNNFITSEILARTDTAAAVVPPDFTWIPSSGEINAL